MATTRIHKAFKIDSIAPVEEVDADAVTENEGAPSSQEAIAPIVKRKVLSAKAAEFAADKTTVIQNAATFEQGRLVELEVDIKDYRKKLIASGLDYVTIGKLVKNRSEALAKVIDRDVNELFPYNAKSYLNARNIKPAKTIKE